MNQEIAKQWVAALRSGKYKQGKNVLRSGDEFCCLGVLCDLHGETIDGHSWNNDRYCSSTIALPDQVREWAGVNSASGRLSNGRCLTTMNDYGVTFDEIARIIEEDWAQL